LGSNLGIDQILIRALLASGPIELFDIPRYSLVNLGEIGLPLRLLVAKSNRRSLGIKLFLARR
jgi:hypothetical protein